MGVAGLRHLVPKLGLAGQQGQVSHRNGAGVQGLEGRFLMSCLPFRFSHHASPVSVL